MQDWLGADSYAMPVLTYSCVLSPCCCTLNISESVILLPLLLFGSHFSFVFTMTICTFLYLGSFQDFIVAFLTIPVCQGMFGGGL